MTALWKDLAGVAVIGTLFVLVLLVAELWRRFGNARPEWTRKLVHLGGGVVCLLFPFLVKSVWTVLVMAAALSAFFVWGRRRGVLRSVDAVHRRTRGSEYYPLAVFLVFVLARGQPWLYVASVLVLAVGDASAALIGGRYGAVFYEVEDERKSLEGSLVFLTVAFLAMHLPMLLLADIPRAVCVLAALLVAILVTGFEAVSLHGADNLFIPLGVCVILAKLTTKPLTEIAYQTASLAVLCVAVGLTVRRTRSFNVGGTVAFILFTYGAWSLGSEMWALPVLLGFAAYMAMWLLLPPPAAHRGEVKVRLVFRAVLIPLVILVTDNMLVLAGRLYGPFLAALTLVAAFCIWNHVLWTCELRGLRRVTWALGAGLAAWAAVCLPPWLILPGARGSALCGLLAVCLPLAVVNDRLMGADPSFDAEHLWSASRIALTTLAAGIVLGLQAAGLLAPWRL
ncbi:MAG: hypothetical protein JXR37_00810 [Kiritimatiellae bacterium]|nr:hypothetical protein [Kiritimatiellia bacterium]